MKRSFITNPSIRNEAAPMRSAAVGQDLTAAELREVHGGELKIEMPAYVPMSQSHPKVETTLPRVPYK